MNIFIKKSYADSQLYVYSLSSYGRLYSYNCESAYDFLFIWLCVRYLLVNDLTAYMCNDKMKLLKTVISINDNI